MTAVRVSDAAPAASSADFHFAEICRAAGVPATFCARTLLWHSGVRDPMRKGRVASAGATAPSTGRAEAAARARGPTMTGEIVASARTGLGTKAPSPGWSGAATRAPGRPR
eukprot:CAMPEP_0194330700 /NCGR_PEP_ID=MMETSP0171-20130528/52923_1 /TAXON_ID=218684 /ORGANISM="Corethron pennatum, Strain L29A3" /LENGTH=110 /DNA_ID=CAMNT_0039091865 /DNA_START=443 /DNA_END=773 /DNA_ORIENTATION=+